MATNEQLIEQLAETMSTVCIVLQDICKDKTLANAIGEQHVKLIKLMERDNDAGTAEIDLCGTCKQRPCGCKLEIDPDTGLTYCTCRGGPFSIGGVLCGVCGHHVRPNYKPACNPAPSPAKCEHESKYVVSGYVSQNDVTCVICSQCSTVGKRFDDGKIEWWPEPSPTPAVPADPVPPWEDERRRRVYYQNIVYAVCNSLDRIFGKHASRGSGICCGTVDSPTDQVQAFMREVESKVSAIRSRQNEKAVAVLKELKNYLKSYVGEYTNTSTMWIDAKMRELGGTT